VIDTELHLSARETLENDPRVDFGFLINDLARGMRKAFDRKMVMLGLTRAQWHTLVYVIRLGQPTQTELAEALDVNRSSAGGLIDQLESSGFISRKADPNDRRTWRIVATPLANKRADEIAECAETLMDDIFDGTSKSDLNVAKRVLLKMQKNIDV
jgi:MarR family transcriptional regulator for hemolysin